MKKKRKENDPKLIALEKQYERLKTRITKLGFIAKGSINERSLTCGNPNCACHKDPAKRHGPYLQMTWKDKAKTRSYFFSKDHLPLLRKWSNNRKVLMELLAQMEAVSLKAGEHLRAKSKTGNRSKK